MDIENFEQLFVNIVAFACAIPVFSSSFSLRAILYICDIVCIPRANLERETNIKILVAGGVYFIAEGIDELVLHYGHLKEVCRVIQVFCVRKRDLLLRCWIVAPPIYV